MQHRLCINPIDGAIEKLGMDTAGVRKGLVGSVKDREGREQSPTEQSLQTPEICLYLLWVLFLQTVSWLSGMKQTAHYSQNRQSVDMALHPTMSLRTAPRGSICARASPAPEAASPARTAD